MQKTFPSLFGFTTLFFEIIPSQVYADSSVAVSLNLSLTDIFILLGVVALLILTWYAAGRWARSRMIAKERGDAVGRSRSVLLGGIYETIAPLLPGFPYALGDMVFIGKWVDYIILDGLSEGKLNEIIFLEYKTGGSKQNANEKMIQSVIDAGKVRYVIERKK